MSTLKEDVSHRMLLQDIEIPSDIKGLSPRHKEVLSLLVHGLSPDSMADHLGLKTTTIRVHLINIYRIMKVKNRREAVARVIGSNYTAHGTIESLSSREREVLDLLGGGLGAESISRQLNISLNTTRTHLKNIYLTLQVDGYEGAVEKLNVPSGNGTDKSESASGGGRTVEALTEQDKQILHYLADGMDRLCIAERLNLTEGTLRIYLSKIYRSLGVHNEEDAVDVGLRQRDPTYDSFVKLRNREKDVLSLLMTGHSANDIALLLSIKIGTVFVYYSNIRRSLHVDTIDDAVEIYKDCKFVRSQAYAEAPMRNHSEARETYSESD